MIKEKTKNKYKSFGIKGLNKRFKQACMAGYLETIKYLLTSPDLEQCVDVHFDNDFAFRMGCSRGYLDIVEFVMESPDLKEHANMHAYNDIGFKKAAYNGHLNIVNYLLKFKLDKELSVNNNKLKNKIKI